MDCWFLGSILGKESHILDNSAPDGDCVFENRAKPLLPKKLSSMGNGGFFVLVVFFLLTFKYFFDVLIL